MHFMHIDPRAPILLNSIILSTSESRLPLTGLSGRFRPGPHHAGEVSPAGEIAAVIALSASVWMQAAASLIITDDRWGVVHAS